MRRASMRTPMLHRCFEEEVVSRRKNARPSRRQKHDTVQCMFLRSAKQGGRHWFLGSGKGEQLHRTKPRLAEGVKPNSRPNFAQSLAILARVNSPKGGSL